MDVSWYVPQPDPENWIGLYAAGAPDNAIIERRDIFGAQSGVATFQLFGYNGSSQEFRHFSNKLNPMRLAISPAVQVVPAATATPTSTLTPTRTVTPTPTVCVTDTPTLTPTTPPISSTPTWTATATPSTPTRPACAPRPNVAVTVVPSEPGRLRATITAQTNVSAPANVLQAVQFTGATGARVEDAAGNPIAPPHTAAFPGGAPSYAFYVRQAASGQAATVFLSVTDACGPWTTFVGGGPEAFSRPVAASGDPGPGPAPLAGTPSNVQTAAPLDASAVRASLSAPQRDATVAPSSPSLPAAAINPLPPGLSAAAIGHAPPNFGSPAPSDAPPFLAPPPALAQENAAPAPPPLLPPWPGTLPAPAVPNDPLALVRAPPPLPAPLPPPHAAEVPVIPEADTAALIGVGLSGLFAVGLARRRPWRRR